MATKQRQLESSTEITQNKYVEVLDHLLESH